MVRRRYKDIYVEKTKSSEKDVLKLTKIDKEKREEMLQSELDKLDKAFGFSKIIQHLSNANKLIIGHNMLLDLCHTLNQFVQPLPDDYSEFKNCCQSSFTKLMDTKLLATTAPLKEFIPNSSLEELKKSISEKPFKQFEVLAEEKDCGNYINTVQYTYQSMDNIPT